MIIYHRWDEGFSLGHQLLAWVGNQLLTMIASNIPGNITFVVDTLNFTDEVNLWNTHLTTLANT